MMAGTVGVINRPKAPAGEEGFSISSRRPAPARLMENKSWKIFRLTPRSLR